MSNIQSRKYQLTINNPIDYGMTPDNIIKQLSKFHYVYYCFASEIGENGTFHTHIFAVFTSPVRFSTIKSAFPPAHIECAYGTAQENRDYILKQGKYANTKKTDTGVEGTFYESGEMPTEKEEKYPQMIKVQRMIEDGFTDAEIIRDMPNLNFHIKELNNIRQTLLSDKYMTSNRQIQVIYIYGATGTGKTSGIYAAHYAKDICRITSYSNAKALFDTYSMQPVIVFEEFRSQIPISDMLSYLDIYPLMLPARYQDRIACYTTVYITSNIPLFEQYRNIQMTEPATWDAFLRRISVVREYSGVGVYEEKTVNGCGL